MVQQSNIIIQSSNNGISRVKLNEPSTYNALSLATLNSLIKSFKNLNDDKNTKVIIINENNTNIENMLTILGMKISDSNIEFNSTLDFDEDIQIIIGKDYADFINLNKSEII